MRNILVIIITLLVISCQTDTDTTQKDYKSYISININNYAKFENDTIGIESFIFSPIDSNTIWTFNTNGPSYQLKLADSSWSKLDKKFGIYSLGLKKENIYKDWIDEELIWVCNFHRGLIAYNTKDGSYTEFNSIKPISSICFLENQVIVGTWNGLCIIDRKEKKVVRSEKIAEINVRKIEELEDSILLINDKFEYNYVSDKILNTHEINESIYSQKEQNGFNIISYKNNVITISKGDFAKEFDYPGYLIDNVVADEKIVWIPFRNLKNGIIKCSTSQNLVDTIQIGYDFDNYKLKNELNYLWFYNDLAVLCFNKKNGSIFHIQLREKINYLDVDSKYVYTNTWHSIDIFDKTYLLQKSIDVSISLNEEENFKILIDSLRIYKTNEFKDYLKSARKLLTNLLKTLCISIIHNVLEVEKDHLF